jgi:hypothetical protein
MHGDSDAFHAGQRWPEGDIEHAAWYMKKLHSDGVFARDFGRMAPPMNHDSRSSGSFDDTGSRTTI